MKNVMQMLNTKWICKIERLYIIINENIYNNNRDSLLIIKNHINFLKRRFVYILEDLKWDK